MYIRAQKSANWAQIEHICAQFALILRSVALSLRSVCAQFALSLRYECKMSTYVLSYVFAFCCALSEKHDKSTILAQQSANWAQNGRKVSAISPLLRSVVLILRSCHVFRATERKLRLNKRSTKCVPFALLAQNKRKISATDRNRAQIEPKVRAKWTQFALCCAICAQFAL